MRRQQATLERRLFGCGWSYVAVGDCVRGTCRRCRATTSHQFRRQEDAQRLARYLGTGEHSPLERVLAPVLRRAERLLRSFRCSDPERLRRAH